MKITSAKFIHGLAVYKELPYDELNYVAAIGRSNVGKSSFINSVTNEKKLARTGGTPGVTQQGNIFIINKKFYLVDLPGYGYAKLSHQKRLELEKLIFWFLGEVQIPLKKVFQLIDAEVGPTQQDLEMHEFLGNQKFETIIIASKIDKLKSSKRNQSIQNLKNTFGKIKIIPFSSKTGEGRKEVLAELEPLEKKPH